MSALDRQEGGSHYKQWKIQPIEFILANGLDYCTANIIKYVVRFRQKGGKLDLDKARHYLDLLEESSYPPQPDRGPAPGVYTPGQVLRTP